MKVATIRSVAELAGVSTATVSRTLAHPDAVKRETRDRVLEAVRATGYVPNKQAVDFRRRQTRTVILLVRDIANPFYLDIYQGVEEYAFGAGYKVLMGDARHDEARIRHYVEMVRKKQADGLILMTGSMPQTAEMQPLPPTVIALETIAGLSLPTVAIDNSAAARSAVQHLLDLGHRQIAHITGPLIELMNQKRHEGYLAALTAAGIAPDPQLTRSGTFRLDSGRHAVRSLLHDQVPFTALFASNDEMAVGAISELRASGRRVPEDVSVVGFDDIVFADAVDPPLTTVRQQRRIIGAKAMAMMIDLLEGRGGTARTELVPTELVVRGTTARLAQSTRRKLSLTERA